MEQPRRLSGNTPENGGDAAVIGLNLFNLIMSLVLLFGSKSYLESLQQHPSRAMSPTELENAHNMLIWLGIFPLVFSSLIFAGPLVRLPGNIKENKARRERSVRKAVLSAVLGHNQSQTKLTYRDITQTSNRALTASYLPEADPNEISHALADICDELGGEVDLNSTETTYTFENMDARLDDAMQQRSIRKLDKQEIGRVVYSSNNDEMERINDENTRAEFEDFDRQISGAHSSSKTSSDLDDFDAMLSSSNYSSYSSNSSKNSSRSSRY